MLLALKLHWSRAEILSLSVAEFDFYLEELTRASSTP